MPWLRDNARFLFQFFRSPRITGAVMPSSKYLAERMVADMNLRAAQSVVEIGPGTGAFTARILREIGPDTRFLAVELDSGFARELAGRFPQVDVVNDSAEHLAQHLERRGDDGVDSILCSLPWASFPEDLQRRLLASLHNVLRPGGRFATFAYVHAAWLPAGRRFRAMLEESFGGQVKTTRVVWRNVPPAKVYRCTR